MSRPDRITSGAMSAVAADTPRDTRSAARTWLRGAFLAFLSLYAAARVRNPGHWDPLDDLNLAVHEAGHLVFSGFGETMTILGGSVFQVLVPAVFVAYFVRSRQRYAAAATLTWVGVNLLNVSRYIGDARAQNLPLLGGENTIHDWWYLLINWDLLASDLTIARWVHFFGVVVFLVSLVGGVWTLKHDAGRAAGRRADRYPLG